MSLNGTASYRGQPRLPALVQTAVRVAERQGFTKSCRVEQGRLLAVLAGGAVASIGETGTGLGVGVAWLVSGRRAGVPVVSVECDEQRAALAAGLFADVPDVEIIHGDWTMIYQRGPFDLLITDGGGSGKKGNPAADVRRLLNPGGSIVIDDFIPFTPWPPLLAGQADEVRLFWLNHPDLVSAELRVAPDFSVIIGTRKP
jgi:predicted O-methyltransferase YrrM